MMIYDVGVPRNISPRASLLSPPVVSALGQAYGSSAVPTRTVSLSFLTLGV